jgi:hypothetical protein
LDSTKGYVPISFQKGYYNIILEAGIKRGAPGHIALDDIYFLADSCEIQPPEPLPYESSEEKKLQL